MTEKITLTVDTNHFSIDLEEGFAAFLKEKMQKDFNVEANNELKELLHAYVRSNYELYKNEKQQLLLVKQIGNVLT